MHQSQPDLAGTWIRVRGSSSAFDQGNLTAAGKRKFDSYDYRTDDPAFRCIASSWVRNGPLAPTAAADGMSEGAMRGSRRLT